MKYKDAIDFVSEYLDRKFKITEEIIKDIHRILVKDVRGGSLEPGSYRKVQNYVANSLTGEIIYKPPASDEVPALMKEFVEWLKEEKDISAILIAGVAQHRFVDIHPFLDGNGRTARESGLDMTAWLEYFVRGLKNQMLEVRTKGEEVIKKDIIIENAVRAGLNDRQKNVLIYLMEKPNRG